MCKWLPMQAKFEECLSILPMIHDYYAKELPIFCIENKLSNAIHLHNGKDLLIKPLDKVIV